MLHDIGKLKKEFQEEIRKRIEIETEKRGHFDYDDYTNCSIFLLYDLIEKNIKQTEKNRKNIEYIVETIITFIDNILERNNNNDK